MYRGSTLVVVYRFVKSHILCVDLLYSVFQMALLLLARAELFEVSDERRMEGIVRMNFFEFLQKLSRCLIGEYQVVVIKG